MNEKTQKKITTQADILRKKEEAQRRLNKSQTKCGNLSNQRINSNSPNNSNHSSLTPAINRVRMTPNDKTNHNRSPLTNSTNYSINSNNVTSQRSNQRKRSRQQYKETDSV